MRSRTISSEANYYLPGYSGSTGTTSCSREVVVDVSDPASGSSKALLRKVGAERRNRQRNRKPENNPAVPVFAGGVILTLHLASTVPGDTNRFPCVPAGDKHIPSGSLRESASSALVDSEIGLKPVQVQLSVLPAGFR